MNDDKKMKVELYKPRRWGVPRIMSVEPIEAVAAACTGGTPKAVPGVDGCIGPITS
jgi:hypothetical protein